MKNRNIICTTLLLALPCFAFSPGAQAVGPEAPDTALPGGNTADGQLALGSLTTGFYNSAFGIYSLLSLTDGSFNTGVGAGTLLVNTAGENTATGAGALLSNTIGDQNTANGAFALFNNTEGNENTAVGFNALISNTTGEANTATGGGALGDNISGHSNTANGISALRNNVTGAQNTANGRAALFFNTGGNSNTATGVGALQSNLTGNDNTAIGRSAGFDITGSGNVCIGEGTLGVAGASDTTWIRNVNTLAQPVSGSVDLVTVRLSDGRLGHDVSSRRYKEDIKPMDKVSEMLFALEPVTYHYKKEIDPTGSVGYGLIAEDVAKLNPDLALRNAKGEIEGVHYQQINIMLLNEFLKEHRKVQVLETTVAQQAKGIEVLTAQLREQAAQIQKVSAQLEVRKPAPQVVVNK
jgi:hypothetical protein